MADYDICILDPDEVIESLNKLISQFDYFQEAYKNEPTDAQNVKNVVEKTISLARRHRDMYKKEHDRLKSRLANFDEKNIPLDDEMRLIQLKEEIELYDLKLENLDSYHKIILDIEHRVSQINSESNQLVHDMLLLIKRAITFVHECQNTY